MITEEQTIKDESEQLNKKYNEYKKLRIKEIFEQLSEEEKDIYKTEFLKGSILRKKKEHLDTNSGFFQAFLRIKFSDNIMSLENFVVKQDIKVNE